MRKRFAILFLLAGLAGGVACQAQNATVSYALTRCVSLWARGENLLAQDYEINLGYPMPRATVMGGINLNF